MIRKAGSTSELLSTQPLFEEGRQVHLLGFTSRAVVLGSSQPSPDVDKRQALALGAEVVRRPSGGGLVVLSPGEVSWVDVILPRKDPLWEDDVSRAGRWLGRCWADALRSLGVPDLEVHSGAYKSTRWSSKVCFAGVGPGEVLSGAAKVVGVSQRRTRQGARFQCAALRVWDPNGVVEVLALAPQDRILALGDLQPLACGTGTAIEVGEMEAALISRLP